MIHYFEVMYFSFTVVLLLRTVLQDSIIPCSRIPPEMPTVSQEVKRILPLYRT